ncbi:phytanoyl-CoA dioxygenase family protein [Kamptonema cortianum]|uniref:Phytanoyl-CoA dioxygenase family protein n=1 Tax=Geitlerinema calcuttense NRMC-F 0142 TaxID=2922238 RepID=A0ABT7LX60_9CYAN|nr:phytanoyl-CoA dioxygenase family protein [Geitlerinema calcuttense]MDK3156641.1 phytanoyl-CoA dioxygenase family protein [Kamptonema cortianum]MDL5056598.1 phytanoyl-CoA dioxygenase family protein [Geitlerinema calcuttense NRMC-F 0142]
MPLSKNQLFSYHELGWVVVKDVFDKATVEKIRSEFQGIDGKIAVMSLEEHAKMGVIASWEPDLPEGHPKVIQQLMGSDNISPTLHSLIRRRDIVDMVEQILGPEIELYHSKLLRKAPGVPGFFPWHQDYGYWHFGEKMPAQVNIAFAIERQTIANGCLNYVPGSHKIGLLNHLNFGGESFAWGLSKDFDQFNAIPVEYEAGDICIFGSLVIHGSEPNRTPEPARFNTVAYSVTRTHKDENARYEVLRTAKA